MQQAMISQFNPSTVLTRFSGIMAAGEQLLETNIPQDQLGSFINLADKSRKSPFERLTLGAPDFGPSSDRFSTFPVFEQIYERVDALLLKASGNAGKPTATPSATKSGGTGSSGASSGSSGGAPGAESSAPASSSSGSSETIESGIGEEIPTTQPDGSPITEEYLVQLELSGQTDLISTIASNNNECSTP